MKSNSEASERRRAATCSSSSIPSRLPDGRANPEYVRQYEARRKAAGNPVIRNGASPEYHKEYRAKRKAEGNPVKSKGRNPEQQREYRARRKAAGNPIKSKPLTSDKLKAYRASPKGKAAMKRWNESDKAKAVRARYMASKKGLRKRHETGDEYASRIIRELEEIYQTNAGVLAHADEKTL